MKIDWVDYAIHIEWFDNFKTYDDLFDFLYLHIWESFIFNSTYWRPIQRRIQSDLFGILNQIYKNSEDYNENYYFRVFECRWNNCSQFSYLCEGQEIIWLFEKWVYNKPLNLT